MPRKGRFNRTKKNGLGSTMMGNIATGATFGVGSGLGHAAVGAMLGGNSENHSNINHSDINHSDINQPSITCKILLEEYNKCTEHNKTNHDKKDCSDFLKKAIEFKC